MSVTDVLKIKCFVRVLFIFTMFSSVMFSLEVECSKNKSDKSRQGDVEDFFLRLFSGEFGYTLIGLKPVSIDEGYGECFHEINERCYDELRKAFVGSHDFVLKIFSDGPYHSIELINKKAVRELVRNNPVVRGFVKSKFKSEESFYSKIEDPDRSIFRILRNNDRIIGYLLGYDQTNIEYYIRRLELGMYLQKYPLVRFHPLPGGRFSDCPVVFRNTCLRYEQLTPSHGFASLESEWEWIKQVEWDISEECNPVPPYFVQLPFYVCRHGGGSELMREKFKRASQKVAGLFCDKSYQKAIADVASGKV